MRYLQLIVLLLVLLSACNSYALDAAKDGPIYGDPEGLARVAKLEQQLHDVQIREDHPRIFITADTVETYRERLRKLNFYHLEAVKELAENGEIVNLAFLYLMYEKDKPEVALQCAQRTAKMIIDEDVLSGDNRFIDQRIAKMALAFDWAYNGMTDEQRDVIIKKLSDLSGIDAKAQKIKEGHRESFETFHREEWSFDGYRCWPEITLAHHNPNADFVYKARWRYDWYWGDAARMYAYAADGTPFEGYYYGADGVEWFLALRSATGINLIDGEFGWCKNAAYYILYRLDLDRHREIMHKGVALGGAGCVAYKEGNVAWKVRAWLGRTLPLALDDPYIRWVMRNEIPVSELILTTVGYGGMSELREIANILFDDPFLREGDLRTADYKDLPLARLFPGGNEAYMRTGWFYKPVVVGFRTTPSYTKTSHGDFDVNTFVIYKDGVLSPDSGVYDTASGQTSYFYYQKNTVAHNNILVVDPFDIDGPRKLARLAADPGGVDRVFTRTFGAPSQFGLEDAFLHNPYANWADIVAFKTTPYYDYVVGEAGRAYRNRLDKYYRTLVFIRKEDRAYLVVYDQVKLKDTSPRLIKYLYQLRWLLHLVTEPAINGQLVKTKVPGHIEYYKADFLRAKNAFDSASLFLKVLLPKNNIIRKVGGQGYEFWVDGLRPKNYPINDKEKTELEAQSGGKWQEAGTWRIEIIPQKYSDCYDFINVFYIGDEKEWLNPDNISLKESKTAYSVEINDNLVPTNIVFEKGQEPSGHIVIHDRDWNVLVSDVFPEVELGHRL
jgi:hypothetical protein